jgi:hypothetical protein
MGKKASAGGENTSGQKIKETKEKKHSNLTQNFFLFFSRGIFAPSSGKNSPSWGYKYPSLRTFIFFLLAQVPVAFRSPSHFWPVPEKLPKQRNFA